MLVSAGFVFEVTCPLFKRSVHPKVPNTFRTSGLWNLGFRGLGFTVLMTSKQITCESCAKTIKPATGFL